MATKTLQLSLSIILLVFFALLGTGILGGYIGSRMFTTSLPIVSDTKGTIVPVSQQVTISPSKATADVVANHAKSVFLLAEETSKGITSNGIGTLLTNDGVIVTTIPPSKEQLVAISDDGSSLPLTLVGQDELSGITFYKINDRIVAPIDVAQNSPRIGSSLLALYRNALTSQLSVAPFIFSAATTPAETAPLGIQKVAQLVGSEVVPAGTPLLDEEGKLAGISIDSANRAALLVSDIRLALDRLSSNTISQNPFTALGFTVSWKPVVGDDRSLKMSAIINTITPNSVASTSGLKVGDTLTAIAGNTISWDTTVYDTLKAKNAALTIVRQGEQRTITLNQ